MQYSIYPTRSPQGGGGFQNVAFLPLSNRTMLRYPFVSNKDTVDMKSHLQIDVIRVVINFCIYFYLFYIKFVNVPCTG